MSTLLEAIKKARESSKKRNFVQTFDLIVNLRGIDTRKPENRINEIVELPYGIGREIKIVVFSDEIKELEGVEIVNSKEIEEIAKDKRLAKKLAKNTDFFVADPKLMSIVAKNLGRFLAPRGKTPKPILGDIKKMIESLKKSVRIRIKDAPVIQCPVGVETMKDEEVEANVTKILRFLEERLPKGKANIKNIIIKLTMGKPVKVEVKK
ncbi:MAG: 50S ribosomal protein L1 [Candidatus Aenigmarchaeota archaeon]|nr:50S ribosomal protein L1 [Candidatus Aenigmarchaeota archaeon]